jgi:hypothetical protein
MYQNTTIIIRKERVNDNSPVEINKGVQLGCPLSPTLFNIYIDKVVKVGLQESCSKGLNSKYNLIHG